MNIGAYNVHGMQPNYLSRLDIFTVWPGAMNLKRLSSGSLIASYATQLGMDSLESFCMILTKATSM